MQKQLPWREMTALMQLFVKEDISGVKSEEIPQRKWHLKGLMGGNSRQIKRYKATRS